ncbi:hypothetical protein ABLB84_09195 [Xenorhabdus szentirmaii]|uniref:hypothetical protein n=1 Tax=Xenorhabdus szentirmaii TaxID=290112 RepID=UPI0032B80182
MGKVFSDRLIALSQHKALLMAAQRKFRVRWVNTVVNAPGQGEVQGSPFQRQDFYPVTGDNDCLRKVIQPVFTQQAPQSR